MQAAVVESFSAPPRYATFDDPAPTSDEVLVTVAAVGLHPIVKALANGTHYGSTGALPFIPGVDGVGRTADGTRVYFGAARSPYGTFAERCVTIPGLCFGVPDALDDATIAAMMNPGMSSWAALTVRADFAAGEAVLILGATGSAGQLSVQIAKRLGARRVAACGRNAAALEELKALGADAVISLEQDREALVATFQREFAENKTDVILDYVWGAPAEAALAAISQKGLSHKTWRIRYVQIGSSAGPSIALPAATLRSSGLELMGSGFGSVSMDRLFAALKVFLDEAARQPFQLKTITAPLRDVEKLWNTPEKSGARLVFQP